MFQLGTSANFKFMGLWAISVLACFGQAPARIVMSPVPILSPSDVRSGITGPAAFFDTARNQVVIFLANADGSPVFREERYDIPNGALGVVSFTVDTDNQKGTLFRYFMAPSVNTMQAIARFSVPLPQHDSSLELTATMLRTASTNTSLPDRANSVPFGVMRFISWDTGATQAALKSPVSAELRSSYLPGFTMGFVEGVTENPITPEVVASLPKELAERVQRFLQPGAGSSSHIVLAPIFRQDIAETAIAANYHFGLSALAKQGQIDAKSPYSKGLLEALALHIQSGAPLALPDVKPVTPLEAEIAKAVKIAFPNAR
jgi:hypothetical protein